MSTVDWKALHKPRIKHAVLLDKFTRWEALCNDAVNDEEIEKMKRQFPGMFETYKSHTASVHHVIKLLRDKCDVELEIVKAQHSRPVSLENIDVIISAGGDGTFLEAASLVNWTPLPCKLERSEYSTSCYVPESPISKQIWVFGINTDPARSEGNLLLTTPCTLHGEMLSKCMKKKQMAADGPSASFQNGLELLRSTSLYPSSADENLTTSGDKSYHSNVLQSSPCSTKFSRSSWTMQSATPKCANYECLAHSIKKIIGGQFKPIFRRRIRISIIDVAPNQTGIKAPGAVCKHDSITRRIDQTKRNETEENNMKLPSHLHLIKSAPSSLCGGKMSSLIENLVTKASQSQNAVLESKTNQKIRTIEYRAVNDVLISSQQSHLTSYIEFSIDGGRPLRTKNSGMIVCTGSGSSAWAYNASKVSPETVSKILDITLSRQSDEIKKKIVVPDIQDLVNQINQSLLFDPNETVMRFVVREPIDNRVFSTQKPSGFCRTISIRPLNAEIVLSLDGLSHIPVKFGQTVLLEIGHEEDVLLTGC